MTPVLVCAAAGLIGGTTPTTGTESSARTSGRTIVEAVLHATTTASGVHCCTKLESSAGTDRYQVETLPADTDERKQVPYRITGPRGGRYLTMRNLKNPSLLFLVNERAFGSVPFEWVREVAPGQLEVIR